MGRLQFGGKSLLLLAALAACQDGPTAPSDPEPEAAVSLQASSHAAARRGETAYVCYTSERTPGARHRYRYGRDYLHYAPHELSVAGAKRLYRYRRHDASGEIIVAANCVIPATQAALERTNRHFRMPAGSGVGGHRLLGGGAYMLEPINVEACQNGNE